MPTVEWLFASQLLLVSQCGIVAIHLTRRRIFPSLRAFLMTVVLHVLSGLVLFSPLVSIDVSHVFFFLYGPLFLAFVKEALPVPAFGVDMSVRHVLLAVITAPLPAMFHVDHLMLITLVATPLFLAYLTYALFLIRLGPAPAMNPGRSQRRMRWLKSVVYGYAAIMVVDLAHQHMLRARWGGYAVTVSIYAITILAMYWLVSSMVLRALRFPDGLDGVDRANGEFSTQQHHSRLTDGRQTQRTYLALGDDGEIIRADTVLWIRADRNYVQIRTENGMHTHRARLTDMQEQLAGGPLVRCHRGVLVNIDRVTQLQRVSRSRWHAVMNDRSYVPVSKSYLDTLRVELEDHGPIS